MSEVNQMKEYVCPRCHHDTDLKANLLQHLKSKNPCSDKFSKETRESILDSYKTELKLQQVSCNFCNKNVSKVNLKRHLLTCPNKPSIEETVEKLETVSNVILSTQEGKIDIQRLLKSLIKESLIEILTEKPTNQMINNIQNITNNLTININSYGQENLAHLSHEFLSHCLLNPTKGITSLIDNIHYNNEQPSNKNIRYKSSKKNTFEKYMDYQWIECDASNTLDELIKNGYKVLNAHYTEFFLNDPYYQDDEIKRIAIEKFRFLSDKSCKEYYSVKRDLRLLIKNKTVYIIAPPMDIDKLIIKE
jgi:hypothetical protein